MNYTLERVEHGWIFKGAVPVDELVPLCRSLPGAEKHVLCPGVSSALGATLVIALDKEHAEAWAKELDRTTGNPDPKPEDWLLGPDTGISSKTIYSVMTGCQLSRFRAGAPKDAGDFGRCFRLLELFPAWRERMREVSERWPAWAGLVEAWPALEVRYRLARQAGNYRSLDERIEELVKDPPSGEKGERNG
jgi:hypothetical protein